MATIAKKIAGASGNIFSNCAVFRTAALLKCPKALIKCLALLCVLATGSPCILIHAQTIVTIAGNGSSAGTPYYYTGTATAASIRPNGVATDGFGNIYISDSGYIRMVAAGIMSTTAGGGTSGSCGSDGIAATAACFGVSGINIDASGNIYLCDQSTNRVRKINALGVVSTVAGNGTAGFSGDGGPATAAKLSFPTCAAFDASGNIYIVDGSNQRIRKINSSGIISTFAGTGSAGYSGDGGPATAARLYGPNCVAVDASGNVYITDGGNNCVREVNTSGIISTVAGTGIAGYTGDGGPAASATLNDPFGIAIDATGNIFISDHNNNTIREINTSGIISSVSYSCSSMGLNLPEAVTLDPSGNLYVSDHNNYRVGKLTFNNHSPVFAGGRSHSITLCEDAIADSLNLLLAISDTDIGQLEVWGVSMLPHHGVLAASCSTSAAPGLTYPTGIYYRPAVGYSGIDSFRIRVNDCAGGHDSTTFHVFITPEPLTITGPSGICMGTSATLGDTVTGGIWTSSNPAIATVGSASGIVSPAAPGNDTITYSAILTCGAVAVTKQITVYAIPGPISGPAVFCTGISVVFNDAVPGGVWSASPSGVLSIGAASGIANGLSAGIATISYTIGGICPVTYPVTVASTPAAITGPATDTIGATMSFSDPTPGGIWSSSSPAVAAIGTSGSATAAAPGCATIKYSVGGCSNTTGINIYSPCSVPIIVTVAGNGYSSGGDGGPATAAGISSPDGIAVDGSGSLYIADQVGQRIRIVNAAGIINTFAGTGIGSYSGDGGLATNAALSSPLGIAVDAGGNLYISDKNNNRVRKVSAGIINTVAGTGVSGFGGDGGAATAAKLFFESDVAVDASGNYYIADQSNNRIRKVTTSGIISTIAGNGTAGYSGDGGMATAAALNNPSGVATDGFGNVYVADFNNNRIRKISPAGIVTTFAGNGAAGFSGDGGAATSAQLNHPYGVAVDGAENVYITDYSNSRIRMVNSSGIITTVAGTGVVGFSGDGGAPTAAQIAAPAHIAVDAQGNVYFSDQGNNRIRKLTRGDDAPYFTGGHSAAITLCQGETDSINTILAANDIDNGQGETWAVAQPPAHGTLAASYAATATGTTITPHGLYYTPVSTYSGTDTFRVRISDCGGLSDTVTVHVTVNPLPSLIAGTATSCTGETDTLSDLLTGGIWVSGSPSVATIGASSGIMHGLATGTSAITYTLPTGCAITKTITVNTLSTPITGTASACMAATTALSDATTGGSWSSASPAIAIVGSSSGIVRGVTGGITTITYALPSGCNTTRTVTINVTPAPITGSLAMCGGTTSALYDPTAGGTWRSITTSVATIDSLSGLASGIATGTSTISYISSDGCVTTAMVTVEAMPSVITGMTGICFGLTSALSDSVAGGFWGSSDYSIVSIDAGTGVATGASLGTATITYMLASSGCYTTIPVTVSPGPTAISGSPAVCAGSSTSLFDGVSGGAWTSASPAVATVNSVTGVYAGHSPGTSVITYSIGGGCSATLTVTVSPAPSPITGTTHVCQGANVTLSDASGGGAWSSTSTGIATVIAGTGVVSGVSAGVVTISYSVGALAGCAAATTFTVNPLPSAITGVMHTCPGLTTALSDIATGGTWLSGGGSATIGSASGIVSGSSSGLATITYTLPTGCSTTAVVTVNPLPSVIGGPSSVCAGISITLTDLSSGGTWSRSNTNVSVGSTGIVTGITAGTSVITYTLPTGCYVTKPVTINASAGAISGTLHTCISATTSLGDAISGGTWTSSAPAIATISSAGLVAGIISGTVTIVYTTPAGCSAAAIVSVNPLPAAYTVIGGGSYCAGGAGVHIELSGSAAGVSYQLYNAGTAIGLPLAGAGGILDYGLQTAPGVYTVVATNTTTGCVKTMTGSATIAINPLPSAIAGPSAVCMGATMTETDGGGGIWSCSPSSVITTGSATGIVTGVNMGIGIVTYTLPTSCFVTKTVTITPAPAAIAGTSSVCTGLTATLTDAIAGGLWTSASAGTAAIGSLTGIVTGAAAGTANITYSLGSGCSVWKTITVNTTPAAITGSMALCTGHTVVLSTTTTGGSWSSGATSVATVGSTGIVSGSATGTATIAYTIPATGCSATTVVTVNSLPPSITGTAYACIGHTTTLSDVAGGGSWTSSSPTIATVGSTGIVSGSSAGVAVITYSLGTGCATSIPVTINPLPSGITGASSLCAGATVTVSDGAAGGTWSTSSSSIATVGSSTGVVSGVAAGAFTVIYTLPTGCQATKPMTVNTQPAAITGSGGVCAGQTISLGDITTGGAWSSSAPAVGSVSPAGIVAGITAGVATITYALPTGCKTTTAITVNALPAAITGTASMCAGSTTTLSDASLGGSWSSSDISVATIGSFSGMVTGINAGAAVITYVQGPGCYVTRTTTVNPLPAAITGTVTACPGSTTDLSDATTGGTWSTSNPAIATVGSSTGIVSGVNAGVAIITYSTGVGCTATAWITVNPLPLGITGSSNICVAATATLTDHATGGYWSSDSISIATVNPASGVVTGVSGGVAVISYIATTGCAATHTLTVTAVPPISGLTNVCAWGDTLRLHDADPTGTYSSTGVTVINLGSGIGRLNAYAPGTATINYTIPLGCVTSTTITVNPLPNAITGTMTLCGGITTTLHNSATGGVWSSGAPAIATIGSASGTVTGIGTGIAYITYTLPTGCKTDTPVHVSTAPSFIIGYPTIIAGTFTTYSDVTPGGTWSTSNTTIATIGSATGIAHGIAAGIVTITYSSGSGCYATKLVSVNITRPTNPLQADNTVVTNDDVRLIPNPNKGTFIIRGTIGDAEIAEQEVWITITNMAGQEIYHSKIIARNGAIEESLVLNEQLANGMYLLRISSGSYGRVLRFVIER